MVIILLVVLAVGPWLAICWIARIPLVMTCPFDSDLGDDGCRTEIGVLDKCVYRYMLSMTILLIFVLDVYLERCLLNHHLGVVLWTWKIEKWWSSTVSSVVFLVSSEIWSRTLISLKSSSWDVLWWFIIQDCPGSFICISRGVFKDSPGCCNDVCL